MPPGETLVLIGRDIDAVWGWWRPHPASGLSAMNNRDGLTCTIFRNESEILSSLLILEAEEIALSKIEQIGPDGFMTYVWDKKVRSVNPGFCFRCAGWTPIGRSADNRKTLLQKKIT